MNQKTVYVELKQILDIFSKQHIKILKGGFNAKVGRRNYSKPTVVNGSLHQDSRDNSIRTVNLTTSKNQDVKAVQVGRMREKRCAYMVQVEKSNGKGLLGKTRRRWEDNIKMHIQEVVWGQGVD